MLGIGQDCSDKKVFELTKQLSEWSETEGYCMYLSLFHLSVYICRVYMSCPLTFGLSNPFYGEFIEKAATEG